METDNKLETKGRALVANDALVRLRCCVCDKTTSVAAMPDEPLETAEIRGTACPACDHGGWDSPTFHREDGSEVVIDEEPNARAQPPLN